MSETPEFEACVSLPELLERLNVPESTFRRWRKYGRGPRGFKPGRRLLFRLSEVEEWLQTQREAS